MNTTKLVTVKIAVQRTKAGWMQSAGPGEQGERGYALGRIVEVSESLKAYRGDKALALMFPDGGHTLKNADPLTLGGVIREKAAQFAAEGREAEAKELLGYLEPQPVQLIGTTVQVPNLPVDISIFQKGGIAITGEVTTGRGGARQQPIRYTLAKGLKEATTTFNDKSVLITARVKPIVASVANLDTASGIVQSAILQIVSFEMVEGAVGFMTEAPQTMDQVVLQQAGARSQRVQTLKGMSLGAGGRVGLTPEAIDLGLNIQPAVPTAEVVKAEPPAAPVANSRKGEAKDDSADEQFTESAEAEENALS